jgi:hypothetical protein
MLYEYAIVGKGERFDIERANFVAHHHLEPWEQRALDTIAAKLDVEDLR